jgi:hypothetical protein
MLRSSLSLRRRILSLNARQLPRVAHGPCLATSLSSRTDVCIFHRTASSNQARRAATLELIVCLSLWFAVFSISHRLACGRALARRQHSGTSKLAIRYRILSDSNMGKLHVPPAARLIAADKLILAHLQKDYEQVDSKPKAVSFDAAEESDDACTKRTELVTPFPQGKM